MKRIEIIANRSVEEDLFDAFQKEQVCTRYTIVPVVHGVGNSGPRMGDHVWPEENFILIVYCGEDEAEKIREIVAEQKRFFTDEGIKIFEL